MLFPNIKEKFAYYSIKTWVVVKRFSCTWVAIWSFTKEAFNYYPLSNAEFTKTFLLSLTNTYLNLAVKLEKIFQETEFCIPALFISYLMPVQSKNQFTFESEPLGILLSMVMMKNLSHVKSTNYDERTQNTKTCGSTLFANMP